MYREKNFQEIKVFLIKGIQERDSWSFFFDLELHYTVFYLFSFREVYQNLSFSFACTSLVGDWVYFHFALIVLWFWSTFEQGVHMQRYNRVFHNVLLQHCILNVLCVHFDLFQWNFWIIGKEKWMQFFRNSEPI